MVKAFLPQSYEQQLRLAREVSLLRFKTMNPREGQRAYLPWRTCRQLFDVHIRHMKALVNWLMRKNSTSLLSVSSKLRSRKSQPIIERKSR